MSSQVPPPDHKFSEIKGPPVDSITSIDSKPSGKVPVVQRPDADEGVIAWGYLAAVAVLFVCIIVFASTCKGDDGQVTRQAENPLENANPSPDPTSGFELDSASPNTDPTVASTAAPAEGATTSVGSSSSTAASTTVAVDPAKAIEDAEESINSKLKASPIQFAQAKADIPEASDALLKEIAESIAKLDVTVVVEGHTDVTGNAAANDEISEDRAKAVMARLIRDGVAEADISAVGKGSDEAQFGKDAAKEDLEKDRKVEIELKAK